jgi:hypothetical protein
MKREVVKAADLRLPMRGSYVRDDKDLGRLPENEHIQTYMSFTNLSSVKLFR